MESSCSPPTSSTKRPRRRAVSAAARGRARCCRTRKSARTARNGRAEGDIPMEPTTYRMHDETDVATIAAMRQKEKNGRLHVQAIAGTHVVLLGMNLPEDACPGLLGFAIRRHDHTEGEVYWLSAYKTFASVEPDPARGVPYSTRRHPIQGFTWSDFSAKPGYDYTYEIVGLRGAPALPTEAEKVEVKIRTETAKLSGSAHHVHFNRGAAASQEYTRRFGDKSPQAVGPAAFDWLSRGAAEAIKAFIERAAGPGFGLRVSAYELTDEHVLAALKDAWKRKADVRILYHALNDAQKTQNEAPFMTFAFGMHDLFQDAYRNGRARLRYALMETMSGPTKTAAQRKANEAKIIALRKMEANKFAIGAYLGQGAFDRWLAERLSGLNAHVRYLHTKYMLVDPLGENPLVVTGSANFSVASTEDNDENMLIVRGDTRVADVYLGECMRLYNHFAFRDWLAQHPDPDTAQVSRLDESDTWWRRDFGGSFASRQRESFSGAP